MATDNSERINKFLREQMTPEENEAFLRDLEKDEALRKEAQLTAIMIQDLHKRQVKQDREIIDEMVAAKKERRTKTVRLLKRIGAVATVLVLIFGVYLYQNNLSDREALSHSELIALANKYYTDTTTPAFRSDFSNEEKELVDLFDKVGKDEDIPTVVKQLQSIHDRVDEEYAYRVNGNDVRIAWYLALAYLKNNQQDMAFPLLRGIVTDDKGTELGQRANMLIEELDKP